MISERVMFKTVRCCLFSTLLFASAYPAIAQLRISENQRYFLDGEKPVVLFGSGLWTIIPDTTVDIEDHNSWYAEWGSNANRVTAFAFCTAVPEGKGLAPWPRTGPDNANDGYPRFDLSQFNEAYWERFHAYLESAQRHGIYVWLQIFDEPFIEPGDERWFINPFNAENNINHIPGMPGGRGSGEEAFYDPDNAALMEIQNALVQRILEETAQRYGHIVYEIGNEINADSRTSKALEWQRHWIQFFRNYEQEHGVKLILSNNTRRSLAEADIDGFDVMNHNAFLEIRVRGRDPLTLSQNITQQLSDDFELFQMPIVNSRPASDPDRVNYPDIVSPDEGRCLYWSYFMSGGHIVGFRTTIESWKGGLAAETILRNLHRFIEKLSFEHMQPTQERVVGDALCLAQPDVAYALYLPVGGSVHLNLSDGEKALTLHWYNPRTGEWQEPVRTDGITQELTLNAPDTQDWAVYIEVSTSS